MAGEFKIKNGAIIVPLAGNAGYIVTVDNSGKLQTLNSSTFAPSGDYISSSEVASISGNLQTQIDSITGSVTTLNNGTGIQVTESPADTWTISVTGDYITSSEVATISGNLETDITNLDVSLTTLIVDVSGNLQSQIDSISGGSVTTLNSGTGIGVVESPADTWTINVTGDFALNSHLNNYTLLTTTDSISSGLDSRLNVIEGGYVTNVNSITGSVQLIAGDNISISGSGQQLTISSIGGSSGLQGRLTLNNSDKIYTISHPNINPLEEFPVVSLDIPTSGSDLFVQGIYDRQSESFKVELSGIPTSSYGLLWHISTQETVSISGAGGFTPLEGTGVTITPSGSDYVFSVTDYISSTEVASISGNLQSQIDSISGGSVTTLNSGTGIQVIESPADTWTINVTGDYNTQDKITLNQIGHSFVVKDALFFDGSNWQLTDVTSDTISAGVLGIVESVNGNEFDLVLNGIVTTTGLSAGSDYYLDPDNNGKIVTPEPTYAIGQVRQYVGTAISSTQMIVNLSQGELVNNQVADISGSLNSLYVNVSGDTMVGDLTIATLASTTDEIIIVDSNGKLVNSGLTIANISGADTSVSDFTPTKTVATTSDGLSGSGPYALPITKTWGNLIYLNANVSPYNNIEIQVANDWITSKLGSFRLEVMAMSGQSFSFDAAIDGIADVTFPSPSGSVGLLFDKFIGTDVWKVRQI